MAGSYGEMVRRYRVAAGLTQEELAALSGLGVRTISDIERGRIGRPHRSTVDLIARALDRDDLAYGLVRADLLAKAQPPGLRVGTPDADDYPSAPGLRAVLDVFPVAIGHYSDSDLADLDVEARLERLVDVLAPFGGRHRPWRHPARDRGADAIQRRLREWASPPLAEPDEPEDVDADPWAGSSVLYWAGYGWSDGTRAALAHAESPAVVGASGLEPQQLAQAIRARQAALGSRPEADEAGGWAMVIIETSHATQIGDAVMAALHGPDAPGRLLLAAVPDDGIEPERRFAGVLANLLARTYGTERRILLRDLAARLERVIGPRNVHQRALGEAALVRRYPSASWMLASADTRRYLEDVLADLAPDERSHFVAKAQSAEHGEPSWFFEGREIELAKIGAWLHRASSGMLVITGPSGSGKSAVLGTVLVRSLPALRDALARRGLAAGTGPDPAMPPESVFDAVIHLSGMHLAHAVTRTADAAGIRSLPSLRDRELGVASDLDFLAGELAGRAEPFTVLADALDESLDPLDIARSLLVRLASLPCVRILVGTRASTSEAPDAPAGDQNLLDALGVSTLGTDDVVWIGRDRDAIRRYVTGRLRAARDYGIAGRAVPHMQDVSDSDIQRAAAEVAHEDREFLFARLAAYELIADPRLLTQGMAPSRGQLLRGTHQQLFGRALQRLASHDDHYPALMRALSLARGRGVPEADGIWAAIAAALVPSAGSAASLDFNLAAAWEAAISGLLSRAAAYITVDTSTGPGESVKQEKVYRLAHRTFVEYFDRQPAAGPDSDPRRLAARALLDAADAAGDPAGLPDYLVKHLSGHAAEAGMWDDLAHRPQVLDRIDPNAVTADAIRTLFGRREVPPPVAGVIAARDLLAGASPADRPGLRQLATAIHSRSQVTAEPVTSWGIAASQAGRSTVHVVLQGHASPVIAVIGLTLSGARAVLASCGDDGTVRLWDPVTATPVGTPMKGHTSTIEDICALPAPGGRTLLAGAGDDGTVRLWDPATGQPVGPLITGHAGPVWSLCTAPGRSPGQPVLVSAGSDGTVRLWDPVTGQPAGPVITAPGPILGTCVIPVARPGQPPILASGGEDGTVRLWDLATGQPAGPAMSAHAGPVWSVCVVRPGEPGHPSVLASAESDGTVRLWDLATGQPAGPAMSAHAGPVWSMCVVPGAPPGQLPVLASGGEDGKVRLWDLATGQPAGSAISAHAGGVLGLCVVSGAAPGQPVVLASAGSDGMVRLWDLASVRPGADAGLTVHSDAVVGVCVVPGAAPGRPAVLASAGRDGTIRLWDPGTGQPAGPDITAHGGAILGICVLPGAAPGRPAAVASAGRDGTIRLWDPATGQAAGPDITALASPVRNMCVVPGVVPGQPPVLASAGLDGTVRLWDPATGQPAGPPITAHAGGVFSVCVMPGAAPGQPPVLVSAGLDGTIRLWDPATGQPAGHDITAHAGPVWSLCAVPSPAPGLPPVLASAGEDGTVRLWDTATGRPFGRPINTDAGGVLGVCVLAGAAPGQGPVLASAGSDGTVRFWEASTGRPAGPVIAGHKGHVRGICVLPGREPGQPPILASAGLDGTVRLWHTGTGRAIGEPLVRSARAVAALTWCGAATGDCLALHGDGTVRAWTAATATLRAVSSPPRASAIAALDATDHPSLLTGDSSGRVHLTELHSGLIRCAPHRVDERAVLAVCRLPGQALTARFAVAGGSGAVTIITILPGGELEIGPVLRGAGSPIRALCATTSPGGQPHLAAAGNDGRIWLWDLTSLPADPPEASPLTGPESQIWSLAEVPGLPAGASGAPGLASAGADDTVRLWDPVAGRALGQPLTGHTDQVRAVTAAISNDGRVLLVSGGHDGTVRLWDPATGGPCAVIPLGIAVNALRPQRPDAASLERTGGGATLTVGLRTGILALDLHRDLFEPVGV